MVTFLNSTSYQGNLAGDNCRVSLTGKALFSHNHAQYGGAFCAQYSQLLFGGKSVTFFSNTGVLGGGLFIQNSSVNFVTETLNITNNSAVLGGGMFVRFTTVGEMMHVTAENNTAHDGGVFYLLYCNCDLLSGNFHNNIAAVGGAMEIIFSNASLSNINVTNNTGSALMISESNVNFNGGASFYGNSGPSGGAVDIQKSSLAFDGDITFEDNYAYSLGGAIQGVYEVNIIFSGNISFLHNTAPRGGGAILGILGMKIQFIGMVTFENNTSHQGGAIFASIGTKIIFKHNITFSFNSAEEGGAMYFESEATMKLRTNTNLTFYHNHATKYGGGIYHSDSVTPSQCKFFRDPKPLNVERLPSCFIKFEQLFHSNSNVIMSDSNSAGIDGNFLFGGLIDKCRIANIYISPSHIFSFDIDTLYFVLTDKEIIKVKSGDSNNHNRQISSEAYVVCFCNSTTVFNCTTALNMKLLRGREFDIYLLALAQGNHILSTSLRAETSPGVRLDVTQSLQNLSQNCTQVSYTLFSEATHGQLYVYPNNGGCRDVGLAKKIVNVTFKRCPDAFNLTGDHCVCEDRLLAHDAECVITRTNTYIMKKVGSNFWMNALYMDRKDRKYKGLILCATCPIEHCKAGELNITLDNPDFQCDFNRSGVLCGGCATTYSLMLGNLRCEVCSNTYLVLLVVFAAAGVALVVFLFILRLTVASGMINSIIIYVNIVQSNRALLFPSSIHTSVLSIFIAWMNLDFGFQVCFFNGMSAYAQTWLQFAFPIYVWFLIGVIILASRYSFTITKLIGSNPISVLATLLLMSYAKILKTIIEIYSSVKVSYPEMKTTTVWLKDGNVPYLLTWHLLLAVVATVFVAVLFLPYTLLLLFGYKMYRFSDYKYMNWLNRLKPLLDSYYAPYERNTRYWTGLLLLTRSALYVAFSKNSIGYADTSLLAIIVTFTTLMALAWLSGKVYTSFYVNAIEGFVYLNLVVLSAASAIDVNSALVQNCLVGMVFSILFGIIVYHFSRLFKSVAWLNKLTGCIKRYFFQSEEETAPLLIPPFNNKQE